LLSVASATILHIISAPPYSVSSDFGQLVGMRHLISGVDCAIAGAAIVAAPAAPNPVTLRKSLRFMESIPCGCVGQPSCRGLRPAWNIRFPNSIPN
jgi:hypothetical protein